MYQYPLIKIGVFSVHLYGVMIGIGLIACFITLFLLSRRQKIDPAFVDFIFYNGVAAIGLGFGGAMVFQAFYNYLDNPSEGFRLGSGMTFMGGLISGVAVFLVGYYIFRRRLKGRLVDVLTIVPPCILVAHAFGRIGCFFGGCCYGIPTDSWLGVKFPHLDTPVHPTMLYEAAFLFVMFGVCLFLLLKYNFQHNMSLYLVTYGIFRFLIEYVRGDERGSFVGAISPSQFWSIAMVALGVGLYFVMNVLLKLRRQQLQDQQ